MAEAHVCCVLFFFSFFLFSSLGLLRASGIGVAEAHVRPHCPPAVKQRSSKAKKKNATVAAAVAAALK
jgi:hypothetical protein